MDEGMVTTIAIAVDTTKPGDKSSLEEEKEAPNAWFKLQAWRKPVRSIHFHLSLEWN